MPPHVRSDGSIAVFACVDSPREADTFAGARSSPSPRGPRALQASPRVEDCGGGGGDDRWAGHTYPRPADDDALKRIIGSGAGHL
jgi:hypothetical protein